MGICDSGKKTREIRILPLDEENFNNDNNLSTVEAVESGDLADFQKLYLQNPNFVNYIGPNGQTLLHHAAAKDKLGMVKLLLHCGVDINTQDNDGNTALHAATENGASECLEYLINKGADSKLKNKKHWAPTHMSVELKQLNALQILVRYNDKVDLFQGGIHGRIPIHLAAIYNNTEAAEIILSCRLGRLLTHHCGNGFTAVHKAVRNAADKLLRLLLKNGEQMGFTRAQMMSFLDSHGQTPLHCAVHSGEMNIVKLCLENGAKIGAQQRDKTSPVHLACSQGNVELVRLLFAMCPDEKNYCLHLSDIQGMTPLHYAAMFDHTEIVYYLIEEGADINAPDNEQRTPLLLAAARSCWATVQMLLRMGADVTVKDREERNLVHQIITHGGNLEDFVEEIRTINAENLDHLLNDRDSYGCTPLHYASRIGKFKSTESLLHLGASVTLRDKEKRSALHFAVKFGRYNTVLQLLHGDRGLAIINEIDGMGMTPLHIASEHGHTKIVQLLLNRGALLQRDHLGRSALHLATKSGFIQTMKILLSVHQQLLDLADKSGETCLHIAALHNKANAITLLLDMDCQFTSNLRNVTAMDIALQKKHHEAACSLATHSKRAPEILSMTSEKAAVVINQLISTMPDVFLAVLDKCIIESDENPDSPEYYVKYDFEYLQFTPISIKKLREERKNYRPMPLPAMNTMVKHRRLELLIHPVCQKYIQMKWNGYGMYFHMSNVLFYIVFMALLTTIAGYLIVEINRPRLTQQGAKMFNISASTVNDIDSRMQFLRGVCNTAELSGQVYVVAVTVLVFVVLNGVKEIVQLYQQGIKYLLDPINYMEWMLYISTTLTIIPVYDCHLMPFQLENTAVAVFVAWFNFLLYLQRFDMVGLYVVMFLEILKTLVKALLIFSILLIAFGLAFHIMLSRDHIGFSNVEVSFIRVFSMMLGEFDFLDTFLIPFVDENSTYEDLPQFILGFLVIFMVLMPILLVNLLIGLAVGDIEGVRRNAHLKRVAMQVELHTELERKLPQFILENVDKELITEYPNTTINRRFPWLHEKINKWMGHTVSDSNTRQISELHKQNDNNSRIDKELEKHKHRLKDLHVGIEQVHKLLRLVVQKLDIKTDADDTDECGLSTKEREQAEKDTISPMVIVRSKLKTANDDP